MNETLLKPGTLVKGFLPDDYVDKQLPLFHDFPTEEGPFDFSVVSDDDLMIVISSIDRWRYVCTTSHKLGWMLAKLLCVTGDSQR